MSKYYKPISNHSKARSKQRLGHSEKELSKIAKRVRQDGLQAVQVKGELYDALTKQVGSSIVYYANAIYIFGYAGVLVTVLNKNLQFDKELYKYTSYPVFYTYKTNRYKYANDKSRMKEELAAGYAYYKNKILELLASSGADFIRFSHIEGKTGNVEICAERLPADAILNIYKETGLKVIFVSKQDVKQLEKDKVKNSICAWLRARFIYAKVNYLSDTEVVVKRAAMSADVTNKIKHDFETEFKRKLYLRESGDGLTQKTFVPEKIVEAQRMLAWIKQRIKAPMSLMDYTDTIAYLEIDAPVDTISGKVRTKFMEEFGKALDVKQKKPQKEKR